MGVTEARLYALVPGQRIRVTVADVDGVLDKYRGESYEGVFTGLSDYSRGEGTMPGKMVNAFTEDVVYGFHDWLIDSIEVLT